MSARSTLAEVRIGGRKVRATSVQVRREITGDLPWEMAGGGGFAAGQVDLTVVPDGSPVRSGAPSPLTTPDALAAGDDVTVQVGEVGRPLVRWATMTAEEVSGSATDGTVQITAQDDLRRLSNDWWYDPLLSTMPPVDPETGDTFRQIGLLNTAVTHLMLRHLGQSCTPYAAAVGAKAIVDAPMMGSLLTKAGTVRRAEWDRTRIATSWGVAMGGFLATWDFPGSITEKSLGLVVSTASQPEGGAATVEFSTVQGVAWKLYVARTYVVIKDRLDNELTPKLPHTGEGRVGVECRWSGDSAAFIVRSSQTSQTATGEGTLTTATVARLCRAFTTGPGRLGSVTVIDDPAKVQALMAYVPSAVLHVLEGDTHPLRAMPTQRGTDPATLLQEQSEADLSAMWIDGEGVWHIAGREWLAAQAADTASLPRLTATNSLVDWGWQRQRSARPSAVTVRSSMPAVSLSKHANIMLWQGGGGSLDDTDSVEEWLEPEDGTDWVEPDLTASSAHSPANATQVNRGRGTLVGAHWTDASTGESLGPAWSDGGATLERVGPGQWRFAVTWQGDPPKTGAAISMAINPDAPGISARWKGEALPILRGPAKVEWRDRSSDPAVVNGARKNAPAHEHNVGWWVQETGAINRVRDHLAARASGDWLAIDGVQIVPDWTLRLGQAVVMDDSTTRVRVVAIVTGIDAQVPAEGLPSMSLTLRPESIASIGVTVGDVDNYHAGKTVGAVDSAYRGRTVADVDAAPLT